MKYIIISTALFLLLTLTAFASNGSSPFSSFLSIFSSENGEHLFSWALGKPAVLNYTGTVPKNNFLPTIDPVPNFPFIEEYGEHLNVSGFRVKMLSEEDGIHMIPYTL
ncbi:MAG: hypothetical protein JW969_05420 [Spirochaetales bacterium]|nr:hypothetical protein [Spirochaetales bacterium]